MKNILKLRLNRHLLSLAMGVGMLGVLIVGNVGTALAEGPTFNVNGTPVSATLDSGITVTETVGGTPTPYDNGSHPFHLDGANHTLDIHMPITLTDFSGNRAGWHVSLTAPSLAVGSHHLPNLLMNGFTGDTPAKMNSGDAITPTNTETPLTTLNGSTQLLYNAAIDTGVGQFTLTPFIQQNIPATAYNGTYVSTFTVGVDTGP